MEPDDKDEFIAQRIRGAYSASIFHPDVEFKFPQAAQHMSLTPCQARSLNSVIR